jgi:adenylate cyclase
MLETVSAVAKTAELKVQARIGIHTGPITAGVIGTHKFVYDVWGPQTPGWVVGLRQPSLRRN